MSCRVYSVGNDLIAGACVVGNRGLGVLGSQVPSSGADGPGYVYNDLVLPADAAKEVQGLIITPPAAGTFTAAEDTSFALVGAPGGTYTFVYRLFVDGADLGTGTGTIINGTSTVTLTAANSSQANLSSAGAIGIDSPVINLAAANSSQANSSSTGAISIDSVVVNLVAAGSTQANTSSAAAVVVQVPGQEPEALQRYTVRARARPVHLDSLAPTTMGPKHPSESVWLAFDFGPLLGASETLASASRAVVVAAGTDALPETLLIGSPVIGTAKVYQRVAGGVALATYRLTVEVDTATGNHFALPALLPVRAL